MKKLIALLVCCALFLCISGCRQKSHRYVNNRHGEYIIIPDYDAEAMGRTEGGHFASTRIVFASFDEMEEDIKKGSLTEDEIWELKVACYMLGYDDGKLPIVFPEKLYEPIMPNTYAYQVVWNAKKYVLELWDESSDIQAKMNILEDGKSSEETFRESQQSYENSSALAATTKEEERNATVYELNNPDTGFRKKVKLYVVADGNRNVYICEEYDLNKSDSVPTSVTLISEGCGTKYSFVLRGLKERPSIDFLCSFGIKEYIG